MEMVVEDLAACHPCITLTRESSGQAGSGTVSFLLQGTLWPSPNKSNIQIKKWREDLADTFLKFSSNKWEKQQLTSDNHCRRSNYSTPVLSQDASGRGTGPGNSSASDLWPPQEPPAHPLPSGLLETLLFRFCQDYWSSLPLLESGRWAPHWVAQSNIDFFGNDRAKKLTHSSEPIVSNCPIP